MPPASPSEADLDPNKIRLIGAFPARRKRSRLLSCPSRSEICAGFSGRSRAGFESAGLVLAVHGARPSKDSPKIGISCGRRCAAKAADDVPGFGRCGSGHDRPIGRGAVCHVAARRGVQIFVHRDPKCSALEDRVGHAPADDTLEGAERRSDSARWLLDIVARPTCQDGARHKAREMIRPWRERGQVDEPAERRHQAEQVVTSHVGARRTVGLSTKQ